MVISNQLQPSYNYQAHQEKFAQKLSTKMQQGMEEWMVTITEVDASGARRRGGSGGRGRRGALLHNHHETIVIE